jgi:hypothetical protein
MRNKSTTTRMTACGRLAARELARTRRCRAALAYVRARVCVCVCVCVHVHVDVSVGVACGCLHVSVCAFYFGICCACMFVRAASGLGHHGGGLSVLFSSWPLSEVHRVCVPVCAPPPCVSLRACRGVSRAQMHTFNQPHAHAGSKGEVGKKKLRRRPPHTRPRGARRTPAGWPPHAQGRPAALPRRRPWLDNTVPDQGGKPPPRERRRRVRACAHA